MLALNESGYIRPIVSSRGVWLYPVSVGLVDCNFKV